MGSFVSQREANKKCNLLVATSNLDAQNRERRPNFTKSREARRKLATTGPQLGRNIGRGATGRKLSAKICLPIWSWSELGRNRRNLRWSPTQSAPSQEKVLQAENHNGLLSKKISFAQQNNLVCLKIFFKHQNYQDRMDTFSDSLALVCGSSKPKGTSTLTYKNLVINESTY